MLGEYTSSSEMPRSSEPQSHPHRLSTLEDARSRSRVVRRDRSRNRRRPSRSRSPVRSYMRNPARAPSSELRHRISSSRRERELEQQRARLHELEEEVIRERQREDQHRADTRSKDLQQQRDRRQRGHQERREDGSKKTSQELRSRSPTFSTKDIENILSSLKSQPSTLGTSLSAGKTINHKNILPEFDPSIMNQRTDIWVKKVNECASVYGWDERTIIHFAMQKLQGLAKLWYESQNSILFTWPEWETKLLSAFPCEQNHGQSLEDMLRRKTKYNEPIEVYFYEKLALLNQCEIVGKKAVDCLIHGLSDKNLRSSANALRCVEPDQLLQFLMSNQDASWEWSQEQERSFQDSQNRKVDRPILAVYDSDAQTELHTDASKIGIGGILLQRSSDSENEVENDQNDE